MTETHDVISAFLDDEPFEPRALGEALADAAGRKLLLDLVALRHLTQADEPLTKAAPATASRFKLLVAAAAVVVALVGGYQLGQMQTGESSAKPPEPTRTVPAAVAWQELPAGAGR